MTRMRVALIALSSALAMLIAGCGVGTTANDAKQPTHSTGEGGGGGGGY